MFDTHRKILNWAAAIFLIGAVCFGHFSIGEVQAAEASSETEEQQKAGTEIMEDEDIINILLIGQDRREGEDRQRSDTMILATMNKKDKCISLTSFMRDLYVQIPGYQDNRINAAYSFGGMELLDETIETNFGIHIDGNVEVDFEVFQTLVDKVGGIDLELTQAEADYICGRDQSVLYPQPFNSEWDLQEGINHLNGEQALIHARNRSIGNSDYRRTERQREVVMAAFDKLKNAGIMTLGSLIKDVLPMVTTDISLDEMLGYAIDVLGIGADDLQSYRIPIDGAYSSAKIRGMQVLVPDLGKNREYLRETLYGTVENDHQEENES